MFQYFAFKILYPLEIGKVKATPCQKKTEDKLSWFQKMIAEVQVLILESLPVSKMVPP